MTTSPSNKAPEESLLPFGNKTLSLQASAPTDIWRKPPNLDVFNAPKITNSIKISTFKSVRVTASGEWSTLYDQGGLVIVLPPKKGAMQKRWIKTGIEFYHDKPRMSVVAADEWADWSLLPLCSADEAAGKVTVEMEREQEDGEWNSVLRVSLVDDENGVKMPIREVTWAFHDVDEDAEMLVGVYAAKPIVDHREALDVNFEKFEMEYRD